MSKRYPGNFITGNPVAISQSSHNGIWDLKDQYQATGNDTWQEIDGIYEISKSLRFRNNGYFTRTPITTSNRTTWTVSFWVKPSTLNSTITFFGAGNSATGGGAGFACGLYNNNKFRFSAGGGVTFNYNSTVNFRDPTAWYHFVVVWDSNASVANERIRVWVNNTRINSWSTQTDPSQGASIDWNNSGATQYVGAENDAGTIVKHQGYMTEFHSVDGQALDPSYFGYTNAITNIWQPKRYTGNYGINGFYLPFNDTTNLYGLGNDKKSTTSIGSYTTGSLTTSVSKFGGSAFSLASGAYVMPGGNPSGYGTHYPTHSVNGKDFTIEFWYKGQVSDTNFSTSQDGVLTGYNYIVSKGRTNSAHRGWGIQLDSNGALGWDEFFAGSSSAVYTSGVNVLDNQWHHIAFSRSAGTIRIYVDGTQYGSGSINNNTDNSGYGIVINGMWDYTNGNTLTYKVGGTIDDFRMYTGIAKYTSNFVAPIVPLPIGEEDQYWGYVSCALPFNGTNGSAAIPAWIPNYWDQNSFSLTTGTTYDSMVDSPSNIFTSATDVGGVVSGNYCTLSPLNGYMNQQYYQAGTSVNQANLNFYDLGDAGNNNYCFGSMAVSTGKWYWEVTPTAGVQYVTTGISFRTDQTMYTGTIGGQGIGYGNGSIYSFDATGTTRQSSLTVLANNQVLGIAVDADNKTIQFYIQGNAIGTAQSYSAYDTKGQGLVVPYATSANQTGAAAVFNFGQRAFAYAPPAGYKSLCTTNMQAMGSSMVGNAAVTPHKWFDINLYGGTGAARNIPNSGCQPNLVWIQHRSAAENNNLYDSARGATSRLESNANDIQQYYADRLTSFNSDGFSLGSGYNNTAGTAYAAWQWKQSPTAGFNIITFTGTQANQTISHNLGVVPNMIIVKNATGSLSDWAFWNTSLGDNFLRLNTTATAQASTANGVFNVSSITSSVIAVGSSSLANQTSALMIAYVFAKVPGFSDFGMYVGNESSNGAVVYTGFKPKYVLIKSSTVATQWYQFDSAREPFNEVKFPLFADTAAAETTNTYGLDFLSNGFKIRAPNGYGLNNSGKYIYMAFAESPVGLNNRAE